ncbi:MAG: aspartate aminotransferase family protein [Rhodospirillales bacterium]
MIPAIMPTYARYDFTFDHGEGAVLWDTENRRFLDFGAGIAVASLGHCHPHLVEAIREQAGKLMHTSNLYHIPGQQRLAERLVANTFADAVFFNNSGNEAVEMGVKMMRRYQWANEHPERYRVITVQGAFHGRSLAMLSAGKQEKHLKGFGPEVDGFDQVAFDNLNELKAAIGPETAGILVEPVQGEGGIRPMSKAYLQALRAIADEFGMLLMFDEVQSGVGRTGKLFAYEWTGIAPDILATAKGIGGGFPLGATMASARVAETMTAGSHGSTYGGNPLAMAAGNAVLDVVLAPGFMDNVQKRASQFRTGLEDLVQRYPALFEDARGTGLMLGLKCKITNSDLVTKLMQNGLLSVPAGDNVVRFVPPLTITSENVSEALEIIDQTCRDLATNET